MSDKSTPLTGEVLGSGKRSIVAGIDGFAALNQLVDAAQECITVFATENTKQARIAAYETTEITRIKAAEGILRQYFEATFDERRANFEALFERLDTALEKCDSQTITDVVRGVVDIAKTSPLADLGDLSQIRAALDDPDQVWDL
ncbi:hypothetical protein [Gordonia sp. WA4-43]|uniref:hypothetical protein n=1 Tax=Gordonia sp. WA4-43 TaxID=2878678 RepID=UPI001CFAA2E2|nr:hypothetical protein [Gordonia sp. WA4-43]UCZ89096.1 hypothetical protein LEL84_18870 [Gordonia sp. WA4-43]